MTRLFSESSELACLNLALKLIKGLTPVDKVAVPDTESAGSKLGLGGA
jgi:hypothetical protein